MQHKKNPNLQKGAFNDYFNSLKEQSSVGVNVKIM